MRKEEIQEIVVPGGQMKTCVMEEWSTGSNTFYGSSKMRTEYGTIGFSNVELKLTRAVIGETGKSNWNEFKKEKIWR